MNLYLIIVFTNEIIYISIEENNRPNIQNKKVIKYKKRKMKNNKSSNRFFWLTVNFVSFDCEKSSFSLSRSENRSQKISVNTSSV